MTISRWSQGIRSLIGQALAAFLCVLFSGAVTAQATSIPGYGFAHPSGYALKVYRVESAFYPYVQVYFRTFDTDMMPLVNLNERNIGLMIKGYSYNPLKTQYMVQSIRQREEAIRTVIVLDASTSMQGKPFDSARRAALRYIDSKRPQDEVAVLAIKDAKEGYEVVSNFERDADALGRRIADIQVKGQLSRLYDTIGAAMQMCGMSGQGMVTPSVANYIVSCSVVVFSDGDDEGSALTREDLNDRISNFTIPVPIYSLAYSNISPKHFRNLAALSKNSFGKYYLIGESFDKMQRIVEEIQHILQNDYVVTFLSYVPVDGEDHTFKLGIEYPSGSGKYTYETNQFEALVPPPAREIQQQICTYATGTLKQQMDCNPYFVEQRDVPALPKEHCDHFVTNKCLKLIQEGRIVR